MADPRVPVALLLRDLKDLRSLNGVDALMALASLAGHLPGSESPERAALLKIQEHLAGDRADIAATVAADAFRQRVKESSVVMEPNALLLCCLAWLLRVWEE